MTEVTPRPSPSLARTMGRVFSYALPHWRTFLVVLLLMSVYAAANGARAGLVGLVVDGLAAPGDPTAEKGKATRAFESLVLPLVPGEVRIPRSYSSSDAAVALSVSAGEVVDAPEPPPFGEDGATPWRGVIRDGSLSYRSVRGARHEEVSFDELVVLLPEQRAPPFELTAVEGASIPLSYSWKEGEGSLFPLLATIGILGMLLAVVIGVTNYGRLYLAYSVQVRTVAALRAAIFSHLSRLGVDFFSGRRSGDLISRLTNDVGAVQNSLRYLFGDFIQHPLSIAASLTVAFWAAPKLTLLVLPFFLVLVVPLLRSGRKVKKHGGSSLRKLGEVTETMGQLLSGIRVVQAFGMEKAQRREFEERNGGFVRSNLRMVRAKVTARSGLEFLYNLLAAGAILLGGWLISRELLSLQIGDFTMFLIGITGLYQPLKAMTRIYNTVNESAAGAERIFELLDERATVHDAEGAPAFPPLEREITFDGVWFRYGEDEPWVLRDIAFTARRGETIALVGPSGAGKSTLLDLLARFHDPTEGAIRIDGADLRSGRRSTLLDQIAIVGQDPFLFHASIGENIRNGRPEASDEELRAAAAAAAIAEEVEALPERFDTVIGDRGLKVSGGQRQRITIARAILKNAPILILDEATSALDSESERKVQQALDNLLEGRTTFVIAHRLSTIQHADRILVLEAGSVVESGTHDELVSRDGAYARLLRLQGIGEDDRDAGPSVESTR